MPYSTCRNISTKVRRKMNTILDDKCINVGYGNSTNIMQFFKSIFPKDANVIMRFVVIL